MSQRALAFGRSNETLEQLVIQGEQVQMPLRNLLAAEGDHRPVPSFERQVEIFEVASDGQVVATRARAIIRDRLTSEGRFSRWYGGAKEADRRRGEDMSQARGARN